MINQVAAALLYFSRLILDIDRNRNIPRQGAKRDGGIRGWTHSGMSSIPLYAGTHGRFLCYYNVLLRSNVIY
jgi:hypothetical protein